MSARDWRAARAGEAHAATTRHTNTPESFIVGVGASGALLAGAAVVFVTLVGLVSFNLWPSSRDASIYGNVELSAAPQAGAAASSAAPVSAATGQLASSGGATVAPRGGGGGNGGGHGGGKQGSSGGGLRSGPSPTPPSVSPGTPSTGTGDSGTPGNAGREPSSGGSSGQPNNPGQLTERKQGGDGRNGSVGKSPITPPSQVSAQGDQTSIPGGERINRGRGHDQPASGSNQPTTYGSQSSGRGQGRWH